MESVIVFIITALDPAKMGFNTMILLCLGSVLICLLFALNMTFNFQEKRLALEEKRLAQQHRELIAKLSLAGKTPEEIHALFKNSSVQPPSEVVIRHQKNNNFKV